MNDHIEGVEISAFLDGALAVEDRARVDAHLTLCPDCRLELESLRHLKLALSSAPRKTLPADLALSLEHRYAGGAPWTSVFAARRFWVPAGAVACAALAFGLWARRASASDELPLEPMLAAHARYSAESLVPEANLVAANYSDQLSSLYADGPEQDQE